jgi:peptidoglycan/xylan/chitin deacetylase (PgdA/CDA1 family)
MLHRVPDRRERDHDLSRSSFELLLRLLERSARPVVDELRTPVDGSVVLTFDDGTRDHLLVARELRERGLPAIFFVPLGRVGSDGHLRSEEVQELERLGHLVGSHAVRHTRLDALSSMELAEEVVESKRGLDQLLERPVTFFAAPGGSVHPELATVLAKAGYEAARSTRWGLYAREQDRWHIPCLPVTELTLRNGWVERVLESWRIPSSMRWVAAARHFVPAGVAQHARRRLHDRYD